MIVKTLIRLWKMFYRLLRLKDYQRCEILSRAKMIDDMRLKHMRYAYDMIFSDYRSYKDLAFEYGCNSASELRATIESLYKTENHKNIKRKRWKECQRRRAKTRKSWAVAK